jgi:hypothetical protein
MRRLVKLCTYHTPLILFILTSSNYRPFSSSFSSFLYFRSFCVVFFYSLPGGFDRFPRCGFFFCYSRLMVIPWVHLFTELPPFFLYDFIFPARGNEDPLFLYGVWPLNTKSSLNQNVADDNLFFFFFFFFFNIFFLPFYIDSRCSRKLLWVGLKLNLWLSFA